MARARSFTVAALGFALLARASTASPQTTEKQPTAPKMSATLDDEARETNLRAYVQLLRSDLRSQKTAVIAEVMQFSEEEDAKFWPVYREYETALAAINDDRIAMVREYADGYEKLSDSDIDRIATRALDLQARRDALTASTYQRLKTVVSPRTAARFLQVEHQILLLLDLQIASALPIASR